MMALYRESPVAIRARNICLNDKIPGGKQSLVNHTLQPTAPGEDNFASHISVLCTMYHFFMLKI